MAARRAFTGFACLMLVASCASSHADLDPWPAATQTIGLGLEQEIEALVREAAAVFDPSAEASFHLRAVLDGLTAGSRARVRCWRALDAYCGVLLPLLYDSPYDARGVRPAAEAWRALMIELENAGGVSGAGRDATARAMLRANTTASAVAAASLAVAHAGEELAVFHADLQAQVSTARAELLAALNAADAGLLAQRELLAEIVAAAQNDVRMAAAGAGPERPEAQAMLDANRPHLALVEAQLAERARLRAALAARCDAVATHALHTGFAAREWAAAHQEAARAVRDGDTRPNFRLLLASAAELGPR
jgi:hypothetical protein